MSKLKLESIITAIIIYLFLIVIVFYAAFYEPKLPKSKNFVEEKSKIIEVSLGGPIKSVSKSVTKKPKKNRVKKVQKQKKRPKKIRNVKKVQKTAPVKRVKKSKKSTKVTKKSKPNVSSLFKKIPTSSIKQDSAENKKAGNSGKSLNKVNRGQGEVNKYFAKVQRMLKGWPAQSNFAGEKVRVKLTIYSSGLFDYKILSRSLNPEFNEALTNYLEQLKKLGGFGPHTNPKPYNIIVEFIAKD